MEMRAENTPRSNEDRTLTELNPNVAALLCYVAGWVSGIVFLILEQKNRFVRFHALQSIIVFGTLTLAGAVLGSIPIIGIGFHWIIWTLGFVLWIILMVKAIGGEVYKLPWAGNLAERLTHESLRPAAPFTSRPEYVFTEANSASAGANEPISQAAPPRPSKAEAFKARYYSPRRRSARMAASAVAIAWCIALLVFFNYYNQYIAYYEPVYNNGVTHWQAHTLITSGFTAWLPILNVTLILSIIGQTLRIAFDKYILNQSLRIVLDVFAIATVVTLLTLFPFNFSPIPNPEVAFGVSTGLTIGLIVLAIIIGIGALVKFISLLVHLAAGKY
jgi:uncharacterized membrane protein